MRQATLIALAVSLLSLIHHSARADFSTPFVEGVAVGTISEAHGYVVATNDDAISFLVIVRSDTMEHIVIYAKADKGAVPAELIGRWVLIKAQLIKAPTKSGQREGAELKILGVTAVKKP